MTQKRHQLSYACAVSLISTNSQATDRLLKVQLLHNSRISVNFAWLKSTTKWFTNYPLDLYKFASNRQTPLVLNKYAQSSASLLFNDFCKFCMAQKRYQVSYAFAITLIYTNSQATDRLLCFWKRMLRDELFYNSRTSVNFAWLGPFILGCWLSTC